MALLELSGIRAGYGTGEVLHGVDLRVPAGCAVALLGSNGAGKTTLLRTAAGLLRPRAGEIRLAGRDVTAFGADKRAQAGVCLIPEGRGIFRRLTVRENIAMQAGGRGVDEAVEIVTHHFPRLGQRIDQVAGTMSGGEQQMLALSRALISEAPVVMADELSVGLAPVVVDEIFEVLTAMLRAGRSLLIVEQYVDRVLALAEYVYILHKGHVAFVGEPAECLAGDVFERYTGVSA